MGLSGQREPGRGGGAPLAWILLLSTLLKLALLVPAHQTVPVGDARDYVHAGNTFRDGGYTSIRPPLWPATLWLASGIATAVAGPEARTPRAEILPGSRARPRPPLSDLDWARLLQVAMSAFSVWVAFLLGRELFDRRAGLVGAGLFAFDPTFVGYTHLLWAETQFALLNLGWALLLLRGVRGDRLATLCAAGLLLGLAALTRQTVMNFVVFAAAWILLVRPGSRRDSARLAAAFALFACLAVAPWTVRNAFHHGAFVPIAPTAGWALLHGVTYDVGAEAARAGIVEGVNRPEPISPRETDRLALARAREIIAEDPSGYAARMLAVNLPDAWRLGSSVLEHASAGGGDGPNRPHGYGSLPGGFGLALIVVVAGVYLVGMVAGLAGMAFAPRWRETLLTGGLLLHACASLAIVGANLRHRVYVMPFVLLYAGFALSRSPAEWRSLWTRRRGAVAAGLLAAFLALLVAADHREVREQWRTFRSQSAPSG